MLARNALETLNKIHTLHPITWHYFHAISFDDWNSKTLVDSRLKQWSEYPKMCARIKQVIWFITNNILTLDLYNRRPSVLTWKIMSIENKQTLLQVTSSPNNFANQFLLGEEKLFVLKEEQFSCGWVKIENEFWRDKKDGEIWKFWAPLAVPAYLVALAAPPSQHCCQIYIGKKLSPGIIFELLIKIMLLYTCTWFVHLMHLIHLIHLMMRHIMMHLIYLKYGRKPFDDASRNLSFIEVKINLLIQYCWFANLTMKCTCVSHSAKLIQFCLGNIWWWQGRGLLKNDESEQMLAQCPFCADAPPKTPEIPPFLTSS